MNAQHLTHGPPYADSAHSVQRLYKVSLFAILHIIFTCMGSAEDMFIQVDIVFRVAILCKDEHTQMSLFYFEHNFFPPAQLGQYVHLEKHIW